MFNKKNEKLPADRHDDGPKGSRQVCPNCSGSGKIGNKPCIACGGARKRFVQGG